VTTLSVQIDDPRAESIFQEALILEAGRFVARDIGVGDPERMTPIQVEKYIKPLFDKLNVNVIGGWTGWTEQKLIFVMCLKWFFE